MKISGWYSFRFAVWGVALFLGISLEVSAKPVSFSQIGARAVFRSGESIEYFSGFFGAKEKTLFFAKDLESGEEWILQPQGRRANSVLLKFASPPDWAKWIQKSLVLVARDNQNNELDRTFFQLGELLDEKFFANECLGLCAQGGKRWLKVWAPTARSLKVIFPDKNCTKANSSLQKKGSAVWWVEVPDHWMNCSYQLQVEVFSPHTGRVENFVTTDPYSYALTRNSRYSVFFDPKDPTWFPRKWNSTLRPQLQARIDSALYELHVRDFSIADTSVPDAWKGKFKAFTLPNSAGVSHLRALKDAGITHIHLLPLTDFTSVEEDPAEQKHPQISSNFPTDSPLPQEAIGKVRALDGYNWGYDPFHYFAPEGSYAVNPQGGNRILEMREMIQSLHQLGLRVVMDMVFNHTFSAELANESVFDRIVPLYYYRLDPSGRVRNSSCCSDTASERKMMEKLMLDSLNYWREHFRIDGFRFDLMNLHSVETMERIRDDLRKRDPSILLYGEAWNFGSLLENGGNAFTQWKAYGNSIGVFNDRIRDAIRGGTTDSKEKSDQGFVTGLFYDFNHEPANRNTPVNLGEQRNKLLWFGDVIRVGMAGNLRDYSLRDHQGNMIRGEEIQFKGGPTGFAKDPEDVVNYVSAHDGYTLWDALTAKLPFFVKYRNPSNTSMDERVDRQILAFGIIALSQGMPFFDSGIEILRSKSGDQNSYDSGDWFNGIAWDLSKHGWGLGLPPVFSNSGDWPFWQPRLAEPALQPDRQAISRSFQAFVDLLKIRSSSALFRLPTGSDIKKRVRFLEPDMGPMQPPGLIVMRIADDLSGEKDLDPNWKNLFVLLNVTNQEIAFTHSELSGIDLEKLYGNSHWIVQGPTKILIPPRSISVMGER